MALTPARSWESTRGSISTWSPARGLYVTRVTGHVDVDIASRMITHGNEVVTRDGKLMGFHHWAGVTGYDSASRQMLTQWGYEIRNDVERVHFLITNKLVRMGVSVASIVLLGMIVSHEEARTFERELETQITTRRKGPERPSLTRGLGGKL